MVLFALLRMVLFALFRVNRGSFCSLNMNDDMESVGESSIGGGDGDGAACSILIKAFFVCTFSKWSCRLTLLLKTSEH